MNGFTEFGLIITLAAALGIIATRFKQPAVLGYIVCGLIIGPLTPSFDPSHEFLELFSQLGITFLLFILGLELNLSELKTLGKVALATGIGQIIFTSIIGYFLAILLGFSSTASIYIAIGLTFSSTIIIVKLLSQKKQIDTLFGRISVGFLLVQDLIAILFLIGLSAFKDVGAQNLGDIAGNLGLALLKGGVATCWIFLFARFVLFPLLNKIREDKEVLFITVIAWALMLAVIMGSPFIGFSLEIGGLMAGIFLANRIEHLQIESWTKPLRDFFITLFFVILGLEISIGSVSTTILPAVLLSLFVLIGNPIIVMFIMSYFGYSTKVSFLTSLSVAQISEFSLLVVKFGFDLGHVNEEVLTLLTLVGGITMTLSTYMIYNNELLYDKFAPYLRWFEFRKRTTAEEEEYLDKEYPILLFGCHRMGKHLISLVPESEKKIVVVDVDAKVVASLKEKGYKAFYGDMGDMSLLEKFGVKNMRIVVSTVPSISENMKLLSFIANEVEIKPLTIIYANDDAAARQLYDAGADFVIYPHMIGGQLLSSIVNKGSLSKSMVSLRGKLLEKLHVDI